MRVDGEASLLERILLDTSYTIETYLNLPPNHKAFVCAAVLRETERRNKQMQSMANTFRR